MIFDDIIELVKKVTAEDRAYREKLDQMTPNLRRLASSPNLTPTIGTGLKKLGKTATVMRHKMISLKEKTDALKHSVENKKKADVAGIKNALQVQLQVLKVANKQADFVLNQFESLKKK